METKTVTGTEGNWDRDVEKIKLSQRPRRVKRSGRET